MNRIGRFASITATLVLLGSIVGCISQQGASDNQNSGKKQAPTVELYVLAAASLGDVMKELAPKYESSHPGQKLVISYGSSGTLQRQIEQGAPADIFISAGAKQMDELIQKNLIDPQNETDLLANKLVLIVSKESKSEIRTFADLKNQSVKKIAIGEPESVPAGTYAKQTLTQIGIWESLQAKFVYAKDVRQVLAYVETGNVDAGIVYKTDAASSDKVKIAATADEKTHSPILYPIGITKNSKHVKEAQTLYNWLRESEATALFTKYGFETEVKK
ncbi:molybdate ABC transporter substrate-binding protein [Effusibacillus dendaii]|uniref:Molybdate ABC transporter substrate-binding protein n=1 Tax=Effusibacillus dendaii TaxID=2743772 RepID=A0A7I8DEB7_9BACL|nr:molybdate ABC transporter substrate-binding protein [Effusibacillus dendaii]BCJ86251.1 molybdate ABC transporter substrate-binding protein [Effusibacillus dendaii]